MCSARRWMVLRIGPVATRTLDGHRQLGTRNRAATPSAKKNGSTMPSMPTAEHGGPIAKQAFRWMSPQQIE
jgi:hypothetical protein